MSQEVRSVSLGQYDWWWKESKSSDPGTKCSRFPTVIHHELRVIDRVPDEGVEFNERKLQWVGEKDWVFQTRFPTPTDYLKYSRVELVFDGLDTVATVKLNAKVIISCDNMFLSQRIDVKDDLVQEGQNQLEILFESAARIGRERGEKYGVKYENIREASRVYVRKAQFMWGWDWGPSMVTCGPYKDIRLEAFTSKIQNIYAQIQVADDLGSAEVKITAEIDNPTDSSQLICRLHDSTSSLSQEQTVQLSPYQTSLTVSLKVTDPELWWPVGNGAQPLYTADLQLKHDHDTSDSKSTRFGIRRVELVQKSLKEGKSFFFRINNKPIFCVGTNWVPSHSLPPCVTPELYKRWLDLALENNNNMIRVWGGGVYEDDAFYDYCDEKGIMLWHDFMFACGLYPTTPSFHSSVSQEISSQVKRLRNHPSITLWCGDNEHFMMLDRQPNTSYDPEQTKDFEVFPERILYFKTIPEVVTNLSPDIPYWPSSPWGGKVANGPQAGDVHQWNVWHGQQLHYQNYPGLGGKFVSEYGMHGFPDLRTVKYFAPDPSTRYPNSKVMDCHNKSNGAESKMGKYLSANFRINWYSMKDYIYLSQLMQSEALSYANRAWRRLWKGPGQEECSGILIWQLNDIYPVTSWSLADSFFRKKPAFFTVKRDFAPIMVGISRTPTWHFVDENKRHEHTTDIPTYEVYASNLLDAPQEVVLKLRMYDWSTHTEITLDSHLSTSTHTLKPNQSTELLTLDAHSLSTVTESSYLLLGATLHSASSNTELSRHISWPEPYRYLLPAYNTSASTKVSTDSVEITCGAYPIKGLLAYVDDEDGEEADWAENMYDLMPGESVKLGVKGLDGRRVKTRWLYDWERPGMLT